MKEKILKIAAEVMQVPISVATENNKELPEHKAYYFWNPVKGGVAVIVGEDGQKLAATSGVSFDKHLQAYLDGRRN